MIVDLQLFAAARDRAGAAVVAIEVQEGALVADLKSALARDKPALAPLVPSLLVAIDGEYARDSDLIPEGAEVAAFPPVSGGGHPARTTEDR